jgi:LysR family hydrogen peroxide-inducible transcriptional activator
VIFKYLIEQSSIQLRLIGHKIVKQAKNIVNEADRIQDIVEQQKGFIGEFRLGIIPDNTTLF